MTPAHYRRLTKSAAAALVDDTGQDLAQALMAYNAVSVGVDGNGAHILHVAGPDRPDLPGVFLADELTALPPAAYAVAARVRALVATEDGDAIEVVVPAAEVPEDAEIVETGLPPHMWL